MRQDAEEFVLPLVDEAQGFRIDAQRLGLPGVGDVVHRQEDECRPLLRVRWSAYSGRACV